MNEFEKLFRVVLDGIRFSLTPIHSALITAQGFTEASITEPVEEVAREFKQFADECGSISTDMLDYVIEGDNWFSRWHEILMKPIGGLACLEIALDVKLSSFLIHPKVVRFVDSGWMGEGERVMHYGFQAPETLDIIQDHKDSIITKFGHISSTMTMRKCAQAVVDDFASSINDLLDPTLVIMSPLARFAFNFFWFICRVLVQQLVLWTTYTEEDHGNLGFDNLERFHAVIAVGF